MDAIARALAGEPLQSFHSIDGFFGHHLLASAGFERPVDRAIVGGAAADRLGYAFAAGYAAALQALLPALGSRTLASLAATEEGGAHPKSIRTELREKPGGGLLLRGRKGWVTLAGDRLLVLAKTGEDANGRARLRVANIPRARAGVRTVPLPELPFVPEIPHAEVFFEDVELGANELLAGDGWNDWVKPFRTVEDLHVHAALLGHLISLGVRSGWPRPLLERMTATLVAIRALAAENASSRAVHIALAGAISQTREAVAEAEPLWASQAEDVRSRWERDRPLLEVAGKARTARIAKAWGG